MTTPAIARFRAANRMSRHDREVAKNCLDLIQLIANRVAVEDVIEIVGNHHPDLSLPEALAAAHRQLEATFRGIEVSRRERIEARQAELSRLQPFFDACADRHAVLVELQSAADRDLHAAVAAETREAARESELRALGVSSLEIARLVNRPDVAAVRERCENLNEQAQAEYRAIALFRQTLDESLLPATITGMVGVEA